MSYLLLKGVVQNTLFTPEGKTREGKAYGGNHQVQLLCNEQLRNGETRLQLFTLNVDDPAPYERQKGQEVTVPVGVFANQGKVQFYATKG